MLILFGVSFRTAPVAVRKTLTFSSAEIADLLEQAGTALPGTEALVLSTCNRTEFYLAAESPGPWHDLLKRVRPTAPATPEDCSFYERGGSEAFRHLARVACGLESAILGDRQLLTQLREAVALSQSHGTLGGELGPATAAALQLGRAARVETAIAAGSAGIGSAVAATLPPEARRVAVLGAGEAARSVARHLVKRGILALTFCNRTGDRAARLAADHGGAAAAWADLRSVLESVDAVAVTTSAPQPVLDAATLSRVAGRRGARGHGPLIVIDAGFPPQVASSPVDGVRVVPLDSLRQGEDQAMAARQAAVPAVEVMVDEAVACWERRRSQLRLSATIRRLHQSADGVTRELAGELAALGVGANDAERIVRRPLRRLLHELVTELRDVDVSAA